MKKILNDPKNLVKEMILGFSYAYPQIVRPLIEQQAVIRKDVPVKGKVALISGGGSGHEPSHMGFVGPGMLDAACAGAVFTSPTADQISAVMRLIDSGRGILQIIKNYSGDVMNFEMAADLLREEGYQVEAVIVNDDVAVENSLYTSGRRGVAGTVFVHKIAGAAASEGLDLAEVKSVAERVIENVRSMGFALSPCTVPEVGRPTFSLDETEMEIGIGIHGEPGTQRIKLLPADQIAETLLGRILPDIPFRAGDEVGVLVNGMGGTPLMELMILHKRVIEILKEEGIIVYKSWVGNFMTSLEMVGGSLTLLRLTEEMKVYLDSPVRTPSWPNY
ncbi:MAG: dihydroxyacetone kinase subunit DhaK [Candidatus Methanomethylicaceae archaeon]